MKGIVIEPIVTSESPRELLKQHFKTIRELPIKGGWGYSMESAVIIDSDDPIVPRGGPFNGVGIEYEFVRARIYEEMIIFQPPGRKHCGIEWKLIVQRLALGDNDKKYDVLRFDVTGLPEADWDSLKAEWEGPDGIMSPDFDREAHDRRREAALVHYIAEYWFDITSFFGRYD